MAAADVGFMHLPQIAARKRCGWRLSAYVPDHGPWQALFYIVAGVSWGIPILPLISWMNRGK